MKVQANDEISLDDLAKKYTIVSKIQRIKGNIQKQDKQKKGVIRRTGNYRQRKINKIPEFKKRIVKAYNLAPNITNEDFYTLFVKYGMVQKASIDVDQKGKSQEIGIVIYKEHHAAQRAIDDLNGVELEQRIITVEFMKEGGGFKDRNKFRYDRIQGVKKRGFFKNNKKFQKENDFKRNN
ncbi:polyadenylate-binding protein, putative, partial [Ichthyophthirius multifiliis]